MDINNYLNKKENDIQFTTRSQHHYFNGGDKCYFVYDSDQEVIWHIDLEFGNVIMYLPEFLEYYNLTLISRETTGTLPTIEDENGNQFTDIEEYLDNIDDNWQEVQDNILLEYEVL